MGPNSSLQSAPGTIEVPARALQPGMYVAAIDRPWEETPFALQGFHVRRMLDVELVARYCSYVQVDPRRRIDVPAEPARESSEAGSGASVEFLPRDLRAARQTLQSADQAVRKVFDQLERTGHLEIKALRSAIDPLIRSVLEDSEAVAALLRIRERGEYLYNHSLCNAVWSAVLGRHLGLPADSLSTLALGASVIDVGMTRLNLDPHQKPAPLSPREMAIVRRHVDLGVELLRGSGEVSEAVLSIVRCHHERFDGSGYPDGLQGQDIPLMARIAGLVDAYDAMITARPHAPGRTSFQAMQELWDRQGQLFQRELVEQFVQAVGLFPTGALVELNTGEVGVVVEQNESRRLRPKVVIVLDEHKVRYKRFVVVDLNEVPSAGVEGELWIRCELAQDAYGVRADEFFL